MDNFNQYWESLTPEQKKNLALKARTSYNHLCQVYRGHAGVGGNLSWRLVNADKNISINWFKPKELQATG